MKNDNLQTPAQLDYRPSPRFCRYSNHIYCYCQIVQETSGNKSKQGSYGVGGTNTTIPLKKVGVSQYLLVSKKVYTHNIHIHKMSYFVSVYNGPATQCRIVTLCIDVIFWFLAVALCTRSWKGATCSIHF